MCSMIDLSQRSNAQTNVKFTAMLQFAKACPLSTSGHDILVAVIETQAMIFDVTQNSSISYMLLTNLERFFLGLCLLRSLDSVRC